MQITTRLKAGLIAIAASLFSFTPVAFATPTQQGSNFILSTTPTQFSASLGRVQKLTFRNIPGYCGKVYIGTGAMNTSTLAGVIKVLYPNCGGGIGDEYSIEDRSGTDGVDSSIFYIAGGIGGEQITWDAYISGVTSAQTLTPWRVGPFAYSTTPAQIAGCCNTAALVQAYVVPGMVGKVRIGNISMGTSGYGYVRKVLWPNTGQNATDGYTVASPDGSNGVWLASFTSYAEVSGETPLIAVWKRQ